MSINLWQARHLSLSVYTILTVYSVGAPQGITSMMQQRSRWVPQPFGPIWLREWMRRHQNPISFALHLFGIPMTIAAIVVLLVDVSSVSAWIWATVLFVGGYGLQFLGHAIEGNDAGELILVKKWLGKPYVAVAPQFNEANAPAVTTTNP